VDRPAVTPVLPSAEWLDAPPPTVPALAPSPAQPPHPGPARVILHVLIALFSLFLIVRTVALEPFGVPTGSMAPAFLGNHREAACDRCGDRVVVGEPGPDARAVRFDQCKCPNCGAAVDLSGAKEIPGDRLMVDKTAFVNRHPRRWEIAVFHCPADDTKPYVKRVVGLPRELVRIADGDFYANGEIQRKTLVQVRETRVLVFDMNAAPADGWGLRFRAEPIGDPRRPARSDEVAEKPLPAGTLEGNSLHLSESPEGTRAITYRHWNPETKQAEPVGDWLAYNGAPAARRGTFARKLPENVADPVHDFLLEFDLEVQSDPGLFACRLGDGADTVRAELPFGTNREFAIRHDGGPDEKVTTGTFLKPGNTHRIEFAFVDRRASLAIDGVEVVSHLNLPPLPIGPLRKGVARPFQLGLRGGSAVVRNLKLYRDIHYTLVPKTPAEWRLGIDEYFLLGDNSTNSHDSRSWEVDGVRTPGVPERAFIGKPFLIHQPLKLSRTKVNGSDRTIQTLDWSRLRWLR